MALISTFVDRYLHVHSLASLTGGINFYFRRYLIADGMGQA